LVYYDIFMKLLRFFGFFTLAASIIVISCTKQQYYEGSNPSLKFSSDTVSFDTVFSTIGSATQRLMVYNPYDKILRISNIKLAGSNTSPFMLNIDGQPVNSLNNIEIYPKDSLYIFVQVLINPTGQNLPLFIRDSILFTINQNTQNVKLTAYGQDIHLIKTQTIKTQTWTADKPYLIYGDVTVDTLETLTIAQGATIYFHKQSNLMVKGALVAIGDLPTPITFRGDRLETDYNDIPGQWGGIYLKPGSTNNRIDWVIIENGTNGLQLGEYESPARPDLEISNTIIKNMSYNGLFAINAKIKAVNCVIADAAMYSCGLVGGDYEFYHCTIANYYGLYAGRNFSGATLKLSNYYMDSVTVVGKSLDKANFYNSIVYGNNLDELSLDKKGSALFQYQFNHCLLKYKSFKDTTNNPLFDSVIWNKDPNFKFNPKTYLELDTLSPAKDAGSVSIGRQYPLDLKKVDRTTDLGPDLGAYERVEKK